MTPLCLVSPSSREEGASDAILIMALYTDNRTTNILAADCFEEDEDKGLEVWKVTEEHTARKDCRQTG
jgi:hypothetical protein